MFSYFFVRFMLPVALGLTIIVGLLAAIPTLRQSSAAPSINSSVVTLEDFSDIVTPVDLGFNDFSGNMGVINDNYGQMVLNCTDVASCALRFEWGFGSIQEDFTGIFLSLFGLKDTKVTTDGLTIETISFSEHHLDLDQVDGDLNEPGGPRRFLKLCIELTYTQPEDLKLRVELKDTQKPTPGVRFTRLDISGPQTAQQHCWDFRSPQSYSVPAGSPGLDIHRAKELTFIIEQRHIGDGVENPVSGIIDIHRIWFTADRDEVQPEDDQELLDLLERRAYQYFLDWSSRKPESLGIPQDRSTFGDLLTIGGTGFGLPAHIIAVERGWISRTKAATRTLNVLRILDNPDAFGPESIGRIGYKGWFYHFLGVDGRRKLNFDFPETSTNEALNTVELSTIDTGLVIMGVLAAQSYFDDPSDPVEKEIRQRAQAIYDRVDWSFMLEPTSEQFYLGWKPNEENEGPPFEIPDSEGMGKYSGIPGDPATLDFYTDEALIVILLATGAITDPISTTVYSALALETKDDGLICTWPGSLFTYQFFHAFFDTRTFRPCSPVSWFLNSRQAMLKAIEYAKTNPKGFATYGPDAWGISAAEGPYDSYHANGASSLACSPDPEEDGTVTYYGMLSAASFGYDLRQRAISTLRAAQQRGHWHPRFALPDAFNEEIAQAMLPTAIVQNVPTSTTLLRQSGPWVQRALFAIDQGPILLHLENAHSGLIWELVARNPNIQRAQERLGTLDQIVLEAEAGSGDGQVMLRSNASGQKTVLLKDGETLALTFLLTGSVRYAVNVRYSNDNANNQPSETVTVTIDGKTIGEFIAKDTGDGGLGWNVFTSSLITEPVDLLTGTHTMEVFVEGGDEFGVEIDAVFLEIIQCFYPSLVVMKDVIPGSVQPGAILTYTIRVANTGNITLTTTITDILPEHVIPSNIPPWTATIITGDFWVQQFSVTITEGISAPFTNTVRVTTKEGVTGEANATVYLIFLPVILK